jgi:hypothetical protein
MVPCKERRDETRSLTTLLRLASVHCRHTGGFTYGGSSVLWRHDFTDVSVNVRNKFAICSLYRVCALLKRQVR